MLHKVQPNRVIAENHQLMRMVKEALRFNSHDNIFLQPFQEGKQFQPRGEEMLVLIHSIARATEMYSISVDQTNLCMISQTDLRNCVTNFSEQVLQIKIMPFGFSLVTKGNYLFLFGVNSNAENYKPIAACFDAQTGWLDLKAPPYKAVLQMASTLLNNHVCIMGGQHISRSSQNKFKPGHLSMNVSQYSIETDSWLKLLNLPKALAFHYWPQ